MVGDPATVASTLSAIRRQAYGATRIGLIGGDREGRKAADEAGIEWMSTVGALLSALDPSISHVWIVQSGSEPRPDALGSLLEEAEREDVAAGIAGSKLLSRDDPDRLISVGFATDVFNAPYTGIDEGEVDHGQYDVVRDVAAVGGASMLVRRDLLRGLKGPDPLLPPTAASIDLCQRARLRGARVVVVPSSEVLVPEVDTSDWREDAGEIRAMLKVYSPLTLFWVLPVRFLVGLLEAVAAPFLGRWTLFGWVKSWVWNLMRLPSTFRARLAARNNRVAGDEELFRFQLRGSTDLRKLGSETGTALRERLPGEDRLSLTELGRELRQPAFVVGAFVIGFVAVATRTLWNGFPSVGHSLPLPASGIDLAGAYAGGWNPGGFGSVEPLEPFTGLAGIVQTLAFGSPRLAAGILIGGGFLVGVWGTTRLLRTWGVNPVPGTLAGLALMAGPAGRAIAEGTGLGTMVALGILPWALRLPLAKAPRTRSGWVGRVAATGWVSGLLAVASPALLLLPVAAVAALAVITPKEPGPWRAAGISGLGTLLAVPVMLPWVAVADLSSYLSAGDAFWDPGWLFVIATAAALVCALVAAPNRLAQIAGWGGVITAAGVLIARTAWLGSGREMELAGTATASLGAAIVCGVALEVITQVKLVTGWRRVVAGLGVIGSMVLVVSTVLVFLPGRAGLPNDQLSDAMRFTASAEGDPALSRVLLAGPPGTLPGESRLIQGAGYRVVSAPSPALWEVDLPGSTEADEALKDVLESLIAGESFRGGADLAPFGIRWIILTGETPFQAVLASQLDLVPLQGLRSPTYSSDAEDAVRIRPDAGWGRHGTGFVGTADTDGRVFVADTANTRWGPDRVAESWGNQVSAADGIIGFDPIPARRTMGWAAFVLFLVMVGVSIWGRRRQR